MDSSLPRSLYRRVSTLYSESNRDNELARDEKIVKNCIEHGVTVDIALEVWTLLVTYM